MKPVLMFITSWCPYCKKAYSMIDDLKNTHPEFANIEVTIIDEELKPEIAKQYDYYYVPTFYVGDVKLHEGVPSKDIIQKVFEAAIK